MYTLEQVKEKCRVFCHVILNYLSFLPLMWIKDKLLCYLINKDTVFFVEGVLTKENNFIFMILILNRKVLSQNYSNVFHNFLF